MADGALSQVTSLLTSAVTLATEAGGGTLSGSQLGAANQEYQDILTQIGTIGSTTEYNGISVFSSDQTTSALTWGNTGSPWTSATTASSAAATAAAVAGASIVAGGADRGDGTDTGGNVRHGERALLVWGRHQFVDRDHHRRREDRWNTDFRPNGIGIGRNRSYD